MGGQVNTNQSQTLTKRLNVTWWALHPDGPAYQAHPMPINYPFDLESLHYVVSELCLQSILLTNTFAVPVGKIPIWVYGSCCEEVPFFC